MSDTNEANEAMLLRIREALSDSSGYGGANWDEAEIERVQNQPSSWRVTVQNESGEPDTFEFTDEDIDDNDRLRERLLKGKKGPVTHSSRPSDPEDEQ